VATMGAARHVGALIAADLRAAIHRYFALSIA
jgi:hypothetical protein